MRTSSEPHVRAVDLGKRFVLLRDRPRLLGLSRHAFRAKEYLWALRHVDFEVEQGSALGVIGPNGSGKSTLLKVMAGVTAPTEGWRETNGRVASLITIGAGFQKELTGRENMYVGGAVLGMSRREVDAAAPAILEFSGLGDAIERPVKHYSSGMFMRLAFSVGISARPDILLIDEVIAVGDAAFRARCNDRVTELLEAGVTLVFVSHNMEMIARLCRRSMVLSRGEPVFHGPTEDAVSRYFALIDTPEVEASETEFEVDARVQRVVGGAVVDSLEVFDERDRPATVFETGQRVTVSARVRFERPARDPAIRLAVASGVQMLAYIRCGSVEGAYAAGDEVEVRVGLTLHLGPGAYQLVLTGRSADEDQLMFRHRSHPIHVAASGEAGAWGVVDLEAETLIRPVERSLSAGSKEGS